MCGVLPMEASLLHESAADSWDHGEGSPHLWSHSVADRGRGTRDSRASWTSKRPYREVTCLCGRNALKKRIEFWFSCTGKCSLKFQDRRPKRGEMPSGNNGTGCASCKASAS